MARPQRRYQPGSTVPPGSRHALVPAVVLLSLWLLAVPVRAQTRLYLGEYAYNNPKLKTMLLDGSALQELTPPPPSDWLLVGLAYDPDTARLYWTHGSTPGLIRRANADGTNPQLVVSGLKIPRGAALDRVHGKVYWAEAPPQGNAMGLIRRCNLDGSNVETIYTLTPYDPVSSYVGKPVVDPVNGYVYFAAGHEIRRVKLDGTGPVQTVVRGFNTATALALDVAANRIYFLDANTNSDILGSARLDDTEFTVLLDNTPGYFTTSGLFDLEADLAGGKAYFTDELQKTVRRCNLDGSGLETIYTGPSTHSPTGFTLDADPPQAMQDCNGNSIRDLDDIESGFSEDCNVNGIPDECEDDPCAVIDWFLDQGSDPAPNGRTLSGNPTSGFEVFQPFEFATVPGVPGVMLTRIALDGWAIHYDPAGFRATIFPDDGSGTMPDESQPLAEADFQFRFSPNTVVWVERAISVFLPPGRYYVRLTASVPQYEASVNVGTSGESSFSRRNSNGSIVFSSYPIALRLLGTGTESLPETPWSPGSPGAPILELAPAWPNPASGPATIRWSLSTPARVTARILDPAGRVVRTVWDGPSAAGASSGRWNGCDEAGREVVSGVYFVRVEAQGQVATERLILLR